MAERMRTVTVSAKVKTHFHGSIFAHVDKTPDGRTVGIGFSVQGRLHDSAIQDALDQLADEINEMIGATEVG